MLSEKNQMLKSRLTPEERKEFESLNEDLLNFLKYAQAESKEKFLPYKSSVVVDKLRAKFGNNSSEFIEEELLETLTSEGLAVCVTPSTFLPKVYVVPAKELQKLKRLDTALNALIGLSIILFILFILTKFFTDTDAIINREVVGNNLAVSGVVGIVLTVFIGLFTTVQESKLFKEIVSSSDIKGRF